MPAGQYAAHCAGVQAGATVVVVGDGAVGLCGVLAAARLGAHRIVAMSRHPARQRLALRLGASDVVAERRDEGVSRVQDLIGHDGADAVLECVGTADAMSQAIGLVRPGGRIGYVGKPVGGAELPISRLFAANVVVGGGPAPVRRYLPAMLEEVLDGGLEPGLVFDLDLPLGQAPEAYDAMNQRRAVKAMLRP